MALKTVEFFSQTCIQCGGETGYTMGNGSVARAYLNQDRVPSFPEFISVIITNVEETEFVGSARTYTVQYDDTAIGPDVEELAPCDIVSLICTSWEEVFQQQFDDWNDAVRPRVTLAYRWNPSVHVELVATASTGYPYDTIAQYVFKNPLGIVIGTQATNVLVIPDIDAFGNIMGGIYTVEVTDSAGRTSSSGVYVDPSFDRVRVINTQIFNGGNTASFPVLSDEVLVNVFFPAGNGGLTYLSNAVMAGMMQVNFSGTASGTVDIKLMTAYTLY